MRAGRLLLLAAPALALASVPLPVRAAPAATFAEFDAAIDRTKEAMMRDPQAALASARAAVAMARRLPGDPRARVDAVTAEWLHGEALIHMNDLTGAEPIVAAALVRAEQVARNTKLHGDLLRAHGAIMAMTGKVTPALREYQRAHDVFQRAGQARSRALVLQDIGLIYLDARDYDRTLSYYQQAADAFTGDATITLTIYNNRAEVYRKQKRYAEAAESYRLALVQAQKLASPMLLTRIWTNLAASEAEAGRLVSAGKAVDRAMALVGHGEAAGWRPFVFGAAAMVAERQGDLKRASTLLSRAFEGVDIEKSDMLFRDYHLTASQVYEALGDVEAALRHAKAYQRLESEANQLTASAASQLMAARFDFTNQNLQISKLKQDQLARDVAAERDKTRTRTLMFSALLAAAAIIFSVLLFGYFALRRSRDAVAAANTSLTDVNGALEKALKAKTEFLATTSHEIRTPLNGILGMTQVLLADRGIGPAVRERIEVVHGAGETMKALVDDILDVAKMESGELTVAAEPTDLVAILDDAARLWSGQAQAKGLELVLDIDHAPRRIVSDGGRLRQIVFNLMSNALKFTSVGRVTLIAGAGSAEDESEVLAIRVVDTGIGIPLDQQAAIFEAFKQVDGGTTRQYGGTGLGLAICKRLAIAMGGDITVSSVIGQGTSFDVLLPLVRAQAERVAAHEPEQDMTLATARMLVLDRNPLNQGVMRVLLGAEAGHVAVADTAAEVIAVLAEPDPPTHLLLDAASIAGEKGELIATLRDLARASRDAGARCSLLLAPAVAGISIAEAMTVGASQLIVKPIGAAALMEALRSLYGDEPDMLVAPELFGARAA
ncbi:MAG TPA: ATP-binding protein [Sphingomonas sp.]|uniref:ATP-binding protein n=1 Tax=Sphingomonas sp. TaxID=28214 RepID=UPI002ED893FC